MMEVGHWHSAHAGSGGPMWGILLASPTEDLVSKAQLIHSILCYVV